MATPSDACTVEAVMDAMACSRVVFQAKEAVAEALLRSEAWPSANGEEGRARPRKKGHALKQQQQEPGCALRLAMEEGGWGNALRLEIYAAKRRIEARSEESLEGELECVAAARADWERSIGEELSAMGREGEKEEGKPRFLFDSDDLLEAMGRIESAARARHRPSWGVVKVELRTPSLVELRLLFDELEPSKRQYGVDDTFGERRFSNEWLGLGRRCLASGHEPVARTYAKRGVPPSLRPAIWRTLLGLPRETSPAEVERYSRLLDGSARSSVVDELHKIDVRRVADNDYYFPFEEALDHLLLAFARDAASRGDRLMPCRGFVHYAAPLTFLYADEAALYSAFRAMHMRYWCHLDRLVAAPGELIHLCKHFERLLADHHPSLFVHLLNLHVEPVAIALPWLQFAFVPILDVDQVLLLWDRILGFDSLLLLPVLATALFVYRSEQLLTARTKDDVVDMFADCSALRCIPLLQHFLWPGSRSS